MVLAGLSVVMHTLPQNNQTTTSTILQPNNTDILAPQWSNLPPSLS